MFEWVFRKDLGGRKEQQDSGCILRKNSCLLAAVADGLGGHSGGKIASETVIKQIRELFRIDLLAITNIEDWIKKVYTAMERAITRSAYLYKCDAMTTVVFVFVTGEQAYWFHLGDSRLYFFSKNGIITRTKDHSQVQKLFDLGMIKEEAMAQHIDQNILLGCLGSSMSVAPSYEKHSFVVGDAILLCTDGFWEYFTKAEMQRLVKARDIKTAANRALDLVKKRGGLRGDNISFIVVKKLHA